MSLDVASRFVRACETLSTMRRAVVACVLGLTMSCGPGMTAPSQMPSSTDGRAATLGDMVPWASRVTVASSECSRDDALREVMRVALGRCATHADGTAVGTVILDVESDGSVSGAELRMAGLSCFRDEGTPQCERETEPEEPSADDEPLDEEPVDEEDTVERESAPPFVGCMLDALAASQLGAGCRETAIGAVGLHRGACPRATPRVPRSRWARCARPPSPG